MKTLATRVLAILLAAIAPAVIAQTTVTTTAIQTITGQKTFGASKIRVADIFGADGTAAAPTYAFVNSTTTGFYLNTGGYVGLSWQGALAYAWGPSEFSLKSNTSAVNFGAVGDLVLRRSGAGWLSITDGLSPADVTFKNVIGQTGYTEFIEMTAPGTPSANNVRVYADDDTGTTRLMAKLPTGVAVDLAGAIVASRLPNPTASTLGGVQSAAGVSNQWINAISTSGVPSLSQPAFSNLSGSATCAQLPALTGDVTTSAGACATAIGATKVTAAMLNADVFSTAHSWAGQQTFTAPILGAATATTLADAKGDVRVLPPNAQNTNYTTVLDDSGKSIVHETADTAARTWTVAANASVAYVLGTMITLVNQVSAGVLTIAINSDTMYLAGAGTTGSRTMTGVCIATLYKATATTWIISGGSCLT